MVAPSVLVTRPSHQNRLLNERLQSAGFDIISFPTIEIQATHPTTFLQNLNDRIGDYDIALFVSRNAVDHAFHYLHADQLPASLQLGVIGKGSWLALKNQGVDSHIIPTDSFNSEGLLASPVLQQVAGKRIIIFRGQQGRNLLGETLTQRGARVDHVEVYRRTLPDYADGYFDSLCARRLPDIVIFTSGEGMRNCLQLLDEAQARKIRQIDWLLISERMRESAQDLGHNAAIIIADSASDDGIFAAIQAWRQNTFEDHP